MRITELANPLTEGLDTSTPSEFVRRLGACDTGLFTGYAGYPNIYDNRIETESVKTIQTLITALQHPEGKIIFGGCGTSGRLAHLLAYELNTFWEKKYASKGVRESTSSSSSSLSSASSSSTTTTTTDTTSSLRSLKFHYLLAGGDKALLVPQEAVEDQHEAGAEDLYRLLERLQINPHDSSIPIVVIGISCGLSATYVASLLHSCIPYPNYFAVAMGFNPVEAIQMVQVPGSPYTFYQILQAMQGKITTNPSINAAVEKSTVPFASHSAILNPVVGPEAVAGSSRMKGGSITWIVCASLCHVALTCWEHNITDSVSMQVRFRNCVFDFEKTVRITYISMNNSNLPSIIADITQSLAVRKNPTVQDTTYMEELENEIRQEREQQKIPRTFVSPTGSGRILYIGRRTSGLMGLIDASEATDTYGSLFNDVRGFVVNGWSAMGVTMTGTRNPVTQRYEIDQPTVPYELRGYHSEDGKMEDKVPHEIADPSLASFKYSFIPTLTTDDCVVYVHLPLESEDPERVANFDVLEALGKAKEKGAKIFAIVVQSTEGSGTDEKGFLEQVRRICSANATVILPSTTFSNRTDVVMADHEELAVRGTVGKEDERKDGGWPHYLGLLSLKLCLNAITTGAHTGRGVIINNRMVNMMLTNHKLYLRAIGIVQSICQQYNHQTIVDERMARCCILRSIYGDHYGSDGDTLMENYTDLQEYKEKLVKEIDEGDSGIMQQTINVASQGEKVIPVALLLAMHEEQQVMAMKKGEKGKEKVLTVEKAREVLRMEPRVKIALGRV